MDAVALLADTWDNDLDPEVSAQLVKANVQAYLSFGKEKGKGKGKGKSKGRYQCVHQRKLNTVLVVERDIGHMIANVQCRYPTRLRKTSHVQLV